MPLNVGGDNAHSPEDDQQRRGRGQKWQQREKSFYPRLDKVIVYAIEIERMTGKRGPLPALGDQWPAKNMTKSPDAIAPGQK